jgi:hypothetical protein
VRYTMSFVRVVSFVTSLALLAGVVVAAEVQKKAASAATTKPGKGFAMDYGPFFSYSLLRPQAPKVAGAKAAKRVPGDPTPPWKAGDLLATKGISVKLGDNAGVCFDIDTCRYAAGWTGGFVDISQSNLVKNQGPLPLIAKGTLVFETEDGPGWAKGDTFNDPRPRNSDPRMNNGEGPLPRQWAHYRGLYRDGANVVFEYSVGDVRVLDMPSLWFGRERTIARTLRIDGSKSVMKMRLWSGEGKISVAKNGTAASVQLADRLEYFGLAAAPNGVSISSKADSIELSIAPREVPVQFTVVMAAGAAGSEETLEQSVHAGKTEAVDLMLHTKGGPSLWKVEIETSGALGADTGAYVIDTVALPDKNPWKSWMKPSGFDFFPDGRAALCMFSGDVWIVSGLEGKLDHVKWRRFATGLYEPLGLRIVENQIYVLDRNGIVRLHDLNQDGEADFYENFNSDLVSDANYHSFHCDLQTDREGNFYYAVTGNQMPLAKPDHSCVVKVSKYGDSAEILSTGLRAANGMGMGPNDELTVGDNQGHWVPASPIFLAKAGAFFGYHGDSRRVSEAEFAAHIKQHPKNDLPICWVPYKWDNSAGGQVWASKNWGPFSNHMLHMSYGKCTLFAVLTETVDGVTQGGVVQLPGKFDSGVMRGRISPIDGQVWLCGLNGWQSSANKDGCFQRVRYTGKPSYLPTELHMTTQGVRVIFPCELDAETANDLGGYTFEAWGYQPTEKYGSDEYKISDPNVKGHDSFEVRKVTLLPDKRTMLLSVEGLKPVTQYVIKMRLNAADGSAIKADIGGSIQKLVDVQ